jgi:hypothetical protein
MRLDRGTRVAVAPLVLVLACGPAVRPDGPADEPAPPPAPPTKPRTGSVGPGRPVLVGEMCPEAAAGRPGIAPLFLRGVGWEDEPAGVSDPIERGTVGEFAVLGFDGKRAGVFDVLGAADAGLPQDVASGTYMGSSACTTDAGVGQPRREDPACSASVRGCGLAVADVGRGGEPPPVVVAGGACVAGDVLIVDIDDDGRREAFPLAAFLDGVRAPAEEVVAASLAPASATCAPRFAVYGLVLAPGVDAGTADSRDPKYQVKVDVLGVADLDGDGRRELALALRYPESRTIVLYSAVSTAARLERVAESVSWP